jgi:predicted nucleic acid-binding protein
MSCDAVIDSYAWIEYFKGTEYGRRAAKYIERGNCATPTIVLAELSDKYHREGWKFWEDDLEFILAKTEIIDLTKEIAIKAGEIKKMMRNSHPNFGLADAIIYETAQSVNAPVLTGDEHFKGVENVIYIKA